MAEETRFRLPRWLQILAVFVAVIGAAFAVWIVGSLVRQSANLDAQRTRELAIAADNIANWPRTAAQIGRAKLIQTSAASGEEAGARMRTVRLYHPDFGELQVSYSVQTDACPARAEILTGNRMSVRGEALPPFKDADQIERRMRAVALLKAGEDERICFVVGPVAIASIVPKLVELRQLLIAGPPEAKGGAPAAAGSDAAAAGKAPAQSAPEQPVFKRDGVILAQIGSTPLPIRRLSDLPKIDSAIDRVALAARETFVSTTGAKTTTLVNPPPPTDALEPTDSRVAGIGYRFYFQPLDLQTGPGNGADFYLVGAATARVDPVFAPGIDARLIAFTLALALLFALVPVIKLAKLGPVDALPPIQVAAVVMGLLTAVALGTTGWVAVRDILSARSAARVTLQDNAQDLARQIREDLYKAAASPLLPAFSALNCDRQELLCGGAPARPLAGPEDALIDTVYVIGGNGRQPPGYPSRVLRDKGGVTLDLSDRRYFQRAIRGESAAGSEALRAKMAATGHGLWARTEGGLLIDQIRSRTDGVPRTVLIAALAGRSADKPEVPAAIAATVVLPSMLAPTLPQRVRYAIIDVGSDGWPALFHADRGRAHIERMADSLDAPARMAIRTLSRSPASCLSEGPLDATTFGGRYEQARTLFGAARIPCTDWVLLIFQSRDAVDQVSARGAVHALVFWAGIFIPLIVLWAALALWFGDRVWCWLWPSAGPVARKRYDDAAISIGAALALGAIVWMVSPLRAAGVVLVVTFAAMFWMAAQHGLGFRQPGIRPEEPDRLDRHNQRAYTRMAVLLVIAVAVVPVAALSGDARDYFKAIAAGEDRILADMAAQDRELARREIDRVFSTAAQSENPLPKRGVFRNLCDVGAEPAGQPLTTRSDQPLCWDSPIGRMRRIAGFDLAAPFLPPKSAGILRTLQEDITGSVAALRLPGIWVCAAMGLALILLFGVALSTVLRGLFGFGVAFEAIEYPRLPRPPPGDPMALDIAKLPRRFMVIAAPDPEQMRVRRAAMANGLVIDLFDATRVPGSQFDAAAARKLDRNAVVLFLNLGVLLRDAERRRHALEILESCVNAQPDKGYRIAVLAELSPLDRLFHSYEREEEELELMKPEDRPVAYRERAKHREEMRWSRLFEDFTTYLYRAVRRPWPKVLPQKNRALANLVLAELEYIPDHVVKPLLPDMRRPQLLTKHVVAWAKCLPPSTTSKAVTSYLQSMLIEHYQVAWSNSSRAERLLLHHFSWGQIPNLGTAYAVRTLVRRGLVVLDPYPRIVNRSFAEFVRHIEKPSTLERWRSTAETGAWRILRMPLMVILPTAVLIIAAAGLARGESLFALLPPLLVAAGPALIQTLGSARRTAPA